MNFNVPILLWMAAFLYLTLHAALGYGMARFRSPVVMWWCASGGLGAVGLAVLGSREWLTDGVWLVFGQGLCLASLWGLQMALRSWGGSLSPHWLWVSGVSHLAFLSLSLALYLAGDAGATWMLLGSVYFGLWSLEFVASGRRMAMAHDPQGAACLKWAGLVLFWSLGIKAVAMGAGVGTTDLYATTWDQALVLGGQFVAVVLLSLGFVQIFIGQDHRARVVVQSQLAREQERAAMAMAHAADLKVLLAEREEIIRQWTLSNKSAGMGALVASFAHELNQPLTANLLHAELLQARLGACAQGRESSESRLLHDVASAMVHDTLRAADIIRKLRNLFRMSTGEYVALDLALLVRDMLDLFRAKIQQTRVELSTDFDPEFCLQGDATQLQQVVLNLINNALDALQECQAGVAQLQLRGRRRGEFLDLEVQDNGPGIAPEQQDDVFSLFKTTKAQGMGVGLWLSRSIAEMHGGNLSFVTEPGQRTVFTLRLPCIPCIPQA